MAELQWAAQAYQARSPQLLNQQAINCFVESTPKEGKTTMPVYGIPGLSLFSRMGNGPIIGLHIMNNDLYILSGPQLWTIPWSEVQGITTGQAVVATFIGTTGLGGFTSMADNAEQLVMVDGSSGWIYQPGGLNIVTTVSQVATGTTLVANLTGTVESGDTLQIPLDNGTMFTAVASATTAGGDGVTLDFAGYPLPDSVTAGAVVIDPTNTLAKITAEAFQPADTVRYFDGYFVFNQHQARQFFISGLGDGTQYSGLDFATATAGSDMTIAIEVYHEQLLVFCQFHTEIWWDSGNVSFPFQRYDAALIARGLSAPYCVVSDDNTVFWMGEDGIYYRLNGFAPTRISTFAMEHAWAQYPQKVLDASGFVLDQEGHKFIVLNFPSGSQTWVYDIAVSGELGRPMWHQRESYGERWV